MSTAVVWFRNILRLHDNPVLTWASSSEEISSIIPIYILEEKWNEDTDPVSYTHLTLPTNREV